MSGIRILPATVTICMACGENVDRVVAFMTSSVRDGVLVTNSGAQRTVKICRDCVRALWTEISKERGT